MKIAAMNASFAPKYMHLQGWSLEIGQNINENIEMWCKNTSKLTKLKNFCLKSMDKLAKERWMYVNDNSKALRF